MLGTTPGECGRGGEGARVSKFLLLSETIDSSLDL